MALIRTVGRNDKVVYGTQATFTFTIREATPTISGVSGVEYINGQLNTIANSFNLNATAGTINVAGTTVTITQADCQGYDAGIAGKIVATSISGWKVGLVAGQPNSIILTANAIGPTTRPTVTLGTATGIIFSDQQWVDGKTIPTIGAMDDIKISGKAPITFTVAFTGGTAPDLQFSNGTEAEQANGTLTYGTAVTLTAGVYVLTNPASYCRLTTKASNTQAILYITC